jgi:large subunit ribosomal protein L22
MTEVMARAKNRGLSAQKARLVVDMIRGLPVERAIDILRFCNKEAADFVLKILVSAIANAEHNNELDIDLLRVSRAFVDEGPTAKRWRARARGRGARILKRTCHITLFVTESS